MKIIQGVLKGTPQCPKCGEVLDGFTIPAEPTSDGKEPEPGNFSICSSCVSLLVFIEDGDTLGFRLAHDLDRAELDGEEQNHLRGMFDLVKKIKENKEKGWNLKNSI